MEFTYIDNIEKIENFESILNVKVKELGAKYIMAPISEKAKKVYQYHKKKENAGTPNTEMKIIHNMVKCQLYRPMRIVKINDKLYSDNNRLAIAFLLLHGKEITLKDIPFYLINLDCSPYQIIGYKDSLKKTIDDIQGALIKSIKLKEEYHFQNRNIDWNISDLYNNLLKALEQNKD